MITVNEQTFPFSPCLTIGQLAAEYKPTADVFILNGFPVTSDTIVHDGDFCSLIQKGIPPEPDEMDALLTARHTPGIQKPIRKAKIAILGLGGLGSAVAGAMAKIGIGKMLLSDYDIVEPSNLNRQHYFIDQIGMKKTDALQLNLQRMNPGIILELIDKQLNKSLIPRYFSNVDVILECFDDPAMKAASLRVVLGELKQVSYIGSSGMAGFSENNIIITRKLYPGIYIVGDDISEAAPGMGLMAPRVGIAAHHMANQALRIILGVEEAREDARSHI